LIGALREYLFGGFAMLNKPPRPRLSKEREHFLDSAATPSLTKEGNVG
jgi:hypothetical protein